MRRIFVAAGVAALATAGLVTAPARADVTVCHDISVRVADQAIADAGCNSIPTSPPEIPAP
jgi:hypothetical protein